MKFIVTTAIAILLIATTTPLNKLPGKRSRPGQYSAPESLLYTPYGTYKRGDLDKILKGRNPFKRNIGNDHSY